MSSAKTTWRTTGNNRRNVDSNLTLTRTRSKGCTRRTRGTSSRRELLLNASACESLCVFTSFPALLPMLTDRRFAKNQRRGRSLARHANSRHHSQCHGHLWWIQISRSRRFRRCESFICLFSRLFRIEHTLIEFFCFVRTLT